MKVSSALWPFLFLAKAGYDKYSQQRPTVHMWHLRYVVAELQSSKLYCVLAKVSSSGQRVYETIMTSKNNNNSREPIRYSTQIWEDQLQIPLLSDQRSSKTKLWKVLPSSTRWYKLKFPHFVTLQLTCLRIIIRLRNKIILFLLPSIPCFVLLYY